MRLFSVFLSAVLALTLFGCNKTSSSSCKATTKAEDDAAMQAYITANGITATKDETGMYYQIINPGSGNNPNVNSRVTVNYVGKLTDGTIFDSGNNIQFMLSEVVPGWQVGLSKIAKGGKIKMIVPPYMGYGCKGSGIIPGNAVLVFDVDLTEVK